jgi:outer membrane protein assembly factor BamA
MFGRDIFLTGLARFGGATNVTLFLENPWFTGNHFSYTLEANRRERDNQLDNFLETSTEISLRLGSYIGEAGRIGALLGFQSIESDSAGKTLSGDNRDIVGSVGFFVGYDTRDLWSNPHTGWWNQFEVTKVGGFPGFDSDFWLFNFDVRRYVPIVNRHTLALFSLLTLTSGDKIAPWQDFHLGGTNSVRGWDLDSRRGKHQFINTAEYRYTFVQPRLLSLPFGLTFDLGLQLALFGDWAVAWDKSDEFKIDNSIAGYGAGVRLLVPFVSQFRFDFAAGESGMGVFVRIGSFPKPVAQRNRIR